MNDTTTSTTLSLVASNDPILFRRADEVTDFAEVEALKPAMFHAMREWRGVGLAAPQIGISKRFFAMIVSGRPTLCINPRIVCRGAMKESDTEGCLSKPLYRVPVARWRVINVSYYEGDGVTTTRTLKGHEARVFQHETDHLDGICIFNP